MICVLPMSRTFEYLSSTANFSLRIFSMFDTDVKGENKTTEEEILQTKGESRKSLREEGSVVVMSEKQ